MNLLAQALVMGNLTYVGNSGVKINTVLKGLDISEQFAVGLVSYSRIGLQAGAGSQRNPVSLKP